MAFRTIRCPIRPPELLLMVIPVAVGAPVIWDGRGIPGFMATGTSYEPVFTGEGIIRQGMIEITGLPDGEE